MKKIIVFCLLIFAGCQRQENIESINLNTKLNLQITKTKSKIANIKFNNKPTIINFFTTTCGACKEELKSLQKLSNEYKNINFIGVLGEKIRKEDAIKFINNFDLKYPIINNSRSVNLLSNAVGGVFGIPVVVVFDKNGDLVEKFLGLVPYGTLKKTLHTLN